ncbi:MAG: hypothetical protein ABSD09_11095 [Xanthobacteraceae bacterium]|jgi:hypothetical protein
MFDRKILAIVVGVTLLALTARDGNAASVGHGGPSSVSGPPVKTMGPNPSNPGTPSYRGYGWGYGRGWCYWHPYACYRR